MAESKGASHPYYPKDLSIPHYVPNDKGLVELLTVFFGLICVVLALLWFYMRKTPHLKGRTGTKIKILWFMACGLIHFVLEGYFSVNHRTLAGEQTFLAQLWKEYGKGDSRYITSDPFTVCMETITAFIDGPLAFIAVYAFVKNRPYRHVIQVLLSLCQLYGDVLYFSTEIMDGCSHGVLWHPLYFWFYFFFMNILWIIFPSLCIVESYNVLVKAQAFQDSKSSSPGKKR